MPPTSTPHSEASLPLSDRTEAFLSLSKIWSLTPFYKAVWACTTLQHLLRWPSLLEPVGEPQGPHLPGQPDISSNRL